MLELTKDWASYKKGDKVDIKDVAVINKGLEIGLFVEVSKVKSKKTK